MTGKSERTSRSTTTGRGVGILRSSSDTGPRSGLASDMDVRWGTHAVVEALGAGIVLRIIVSESDRGRLGDIVARATRSGVDVGVVAQGVLDRVSRGARHQGIVAHVRPFQYTSYEELRVHVARAGDRAMLLALDGVEDPQNFGASLRSAEGAGVTGVIVGARRAAPVTGAVARASAGAVDRTAITEVTNVASTLVALKRDGFTVYGLDASGDAIFSESEYPGRVIIVAGSEGRGLGRQVLEACDVRVRIPMHGRVASLNVSVSVALGLFAVCDWRRRLDQAMVGRPEGV